MDSGLRNNYLVNCIRTLSDQAKNRKRDLFGCFLDFKQAFDSCDRATVLAILGKLGLHPSLIRMSSDLIGGFETCVNVDGSHSEPLTMERGVPQGSVLGPHLFKTLLAWNLLLINRILRALC